MIGIVDHHLGLEHMQVALFTCLQIVRGHLALPVDATDNANKVGSMQETPRS